MGKRLGRLRAGLIRQDTDICWTKFWQTVHMKKLSVIALVFALTGCANSQALNSFTISQNEISAVAVADQSNFSVSRVIVLANGVAEIMLALNAKSLVIGRDISSTESALSDVPIVTSGHQVIPEKIISLKPDLVIIDASTGPKVALDQIRSAGIKIVETPESWTLADIAPKITAVSQVIGAEKAGAALIAKLSATSQFTKVTGNPKVAFLYLRGTSSIYLIGGPGSGTDSMLAAVGATDVGAEKLPRAFNTLTAESLAELNPDVILVMSKGLESVGGVQGLIKLPGVAQTKAGKNAAIIDVDDSLLLSFGPRTYSLVNQLAKAIDAVNQ